MTNTDKIKELLSKSCPRNIDEITSDKNLFSDLELDSFGLMELIISFEDEFDLVISDSDVHKFTTVQDIIDYIETSTAKKS